MSYFQEMPGGIGGDLALANPFLAKLELRDDFKGKEPNPLLPLIAQMDAIEDPFQRMAFALYVLFPAMMKNEEETLEELSDDLKEDAEYTEELSRIKQMFNSFRESVDTAKVEQFHKAIEDLLKKIEASDAISPSIKEQITNALSEMSDKIEKLGPEGAASYFKRVWKFEDIDDAQKQAGELKYWQDRFDVSTTSLTSVSSIVQAEYQYYSARYQTMLSAFKDLLKKFHDQMQHAVDAERI